MKHLALFMSVIFVITGAAAAPNLGNAGNVPGDALYGLDRAAESISLALTFSREAKANKSLRFARERLAEAEKLRERNRTDLVNRSLEQYRRQIQRSERITDSIPDKAKQQRVSDRISNASMRHAEALNRMSVARGNPLYRAKLEAEETSVSLESNPVQKARKQAKALQHRMNETEILAERNRTRAMNRTLQHYRENLEEMERAANVSDNETRMRVHAVIGNATQKHIQVLERVRQKVPEEARKGIDNALNRSRTGNEKARKAFQKARRAVKRGEGNAPGQSMPGKGTS